MSEDEFGAFDYSDLTPADWDHISQLEQRHHASPIASHTPMRAPPRVSLFQRFRPAHNLSVSDLVGPLWCEVKFDYTLRWGKKYERVESKPDAIVTAQGKTIVVKKAAAARNEGIMDAGTVSSYSLPLLLPLNRTPGCAQKT